MGEHFLVDLKGSESLFPTKIFSVFENFDLIGYYVCKKHSEV